MSHDIYQFVITAMAQKTADPVQKLEERLTCPVCLELFKNPKTLPCQHSFCQDCLGPCPRELEEGKNYLKCPTCRKPAQLPDRGVPALPPAFTINSFLELHQEMLAKQESMECPQHKKPLEAFCDTCQQLVCFFCATRSHNNHCVQMIADIIHDCKQQLKKGLQPVNQQTATIMDGIQDIDNCDEALTHQGEDVEQQIHLQAQEARAAVDQAERKLIEEVRAAIQQKRGVIALQKQEAQDELARLQSSAEFVEQSIKMQSDQQIVASKMKILDRIKASISRAKNCTLKPVERIDLIYERNEKAVEECKRLGMLRYSHLSQKCHLTLQPVAPGRKAHCQLSVQDNDGSPLPISTSLISCQLAPNNGPQPADCTIMETGLGKYEICYIPVVHGSHQLRVMVGDSDIPGSVFPIPVLQPSPENRGHPLHTIQGLNEPQYVAVSRRGQMIVSENGAHCITIFSSDLQPIMSVGSHGAGTNQFNGPAGIAITKDDCILVADCCNHRIQVLTMEGQFLASVGSKGKGPLQFHFPASIAVHPNGQVLVSEGNSNRIQVLNKDLSLSHFFVTHGSPRGKGEGHFGMDVDRQGAIYITDGRDCCVQKFSISGQFIAKFVSAGIRKGDLAEPWGIAVDDKDHVYISELANQRVSIFTSNGNFIKSFETHGNDEDSEDEDRGLPGLTALAVDKNGNLYACNPRIGQVKIF